MNFQEFEKKAKCLYCERPINVKMRKLNFMAPGTARLRGVKSTKNSYCCECSLSKRIKLKNGYTFYLPVSQKYEIFIDTREPVFKVDLVTCVNPDAPANQQLKTVENILTIDELPEFISLPRVKLISKLEEYLAFI